MIYKISTLRRFTSNDYYFSSHLITHQISLLQSAYLTHTCNSSDKKKEVRDLKLIELVVVDPYQNTI